MPRSTKVVVSGAPQERHGSASEAGSGCDAMLSFRRVEIVPMSVDPELLSMLVCPKSRGALELVALPAALSTRLVERYREHFRDEEPVVENGLLCRESGWSIRSSPTSRSCSSTRRSRPRFSPPEADAPVRRSAPRRSRVPSESPARADRAPARSLVFRPLRRPPPDSLRHRAVEHRARAGDPRDAVPARSPGRGAAPRPAAPPRRWPPTSALFLCRSRCRTIRGASLTALGEFFTLAARRSRCSRCATSAGSAGWSTR